MAVLLKSFLVLHILSGFLSLASGTVSILSRKGARLHRLAGKFFFFGMIGVCISATAISLVKGNEFLFLIGIFAFYQTFSGWRAVKNKSLKPAPADWLVLIAGTLNGLYMIGTLKMVLVVFGIISSVAAAQHWHLLLRVKKGKKPATAGWLRMHIGMMMGAFIATVTAFLVVNYKVFSSLHLPAWFFWLFPTLVLSPLIAYWTRKYTRNERRLA